MRYGKTGRKDKRALHDPHKDTSISTSIDVPSIELHNQDGSFQRVKHAPNNLIYQKAAELIANNFHNNINRIPGKTSSNSQKILRSTSRSGKSKKSKLKSQFKKSGSNLDKSLPGKKDQTHRKSKSDAKKMAEEMFKNSSNKNYKTNPKLRKSNYIDQILNERSFIPRGHDPNERESPMSIPHSYLFGQIGQNWIDNINHQIEKNGKDLLESINKVKQKNAANMQEMNKKRRKSKQSRPQSTNFVNIQHPQNANEAFKSILQNKLNTEFMVGKDFNDSENLITFDQHLPQHNLSYNPEFGGYNARRDIKPDLTGAQISLNQK